MTGVQTCALPILLDAWADLDRDAVLWVVSDGPQTAELRAGGVANVEWLGRITDADLASRLRGATVFCAPSLGQESFGVVLLEAMAAGLQGCRGVVKVGGAHAANLTNPVPVNAAILEFLAGLPA